MNPPDGIVTLASLPRSSAFLTVPESARVLGVSVKTVRRLITAGRLKAKRHNSATVRVAWDWLIEYAAQHDNARRGAR